MNASQRKYWGDQVGSFVNRYFPKGSLRYRLLGGTFWMVTGNGVAQLVAFGVMLVCARFLGSTDFGKFGIIQSTLTLFSLYAGFGMGLATQRYVGELRDQNPERCGRLIGLATVVTWCTAGTLSLVLFVSAPWIATIILNAPDLGEELRVATVVLLLNSLNGVQIGTLSGLEQFTEVARLNFVRAAISPVLLIGGVWLWGISGLVAGMGIVSLLVWLLTGRILKQSLVDAGISIRYDHISQEKQILWDLTIPAIASGTLPVFVFWIARAILVQYPDGYAQLGVFTAAEQWLAVLALVPGQISNVSLPILSNIYATKDRIRFRKAILVTTTLPVVIASVFALLLIVVANSVSALYGETFGGLSSVLIVVCLVGVLRVLGGAIGTLYATINRMWISFGVNTLWGIVLIAATVILAAQGALGLAYANLIAYSLHGVLGLGVFYWFGIRSWREPTPLNASTGL